MWTIQDVFKYIYITLKGYPAPNLVLINFISEDHRLSGLFFAACAKILNSNIVDIIGSLSMSSHEYANLKLDDSSIQYLFDKGFLPTVDINNITNNV